MAVGDSIKRVDAYGKVTGRAKYTADLEPKNLLIAKVVRSTIANGVVKSFDLSEALKVPGVIKIVTCFDVPDIQFPTPGHPWSIEKAHQDIADRKLLTSRVRIYGDDIAAVVATDEVAATKAVRLVKVEYEEYEPLVTTAKAMSEGAGAIHEEKQNNILVHSSLKVGDLSFEEACQEPDLLVMEKNYKTVTVQHCHIEVVVSYAYMENERIVIVSSTQIPHIVRRVVGQALGIPWGQVRVIKPYIGGGFGNKQEVLYEPLNAFLCVQVGGRAVKIELTREETMACTRVRHAIEFEVEAAARKDGTLVARRVKAYSNQGGYASHGHAIVANAINEIKQIYHDEKALEEEAFSVYTNISVGGAMRAYGIPQGAFAAECMAEDLACALKIDPLQFRLKNCMQADYEDPHTHVKFNSYGLTECMIKGRDYIKWDEKREKYNHQTGMIRRGVGMAIFCYKTGVYPISLETSSCRMILNQDGSMQLQLGGTEIGQGADTVFIQMASEVTGINQDKIYIVSTQDTDVTPFDTGAYASRQTYVCGKAIKKTGLLLKEKILDYAQYKLDRMTDTMDVMHDYIIEKETGKQLLSLAELALEAFYSLDRSVHLTAEATNHCKENTFSSGVCFVEIEVDIPLGKIKVLDIINVHDSGILINPKLAEAQVHGGMSMGLGYGLSEHLMFNEKGQPLNDNLLDYKLPTAMDTPDLHVEFVQIEDPTGPFGNKSLGEPPAVPVAPALRNALLHATGVAINSLPLDPQKLVESFMAAGLIHSSQNDGI